MPAATWLSARPLRYPTRHILSEISLYATKSRKINTVCAGRPELSHHDLRLLIGVRSPRETDHMDRQIRRESFQTRFMRVNSIPVQSRRSFRDFLV